jgi:hypothetical protein
MHGRRVRNVQDVRGKLAQKFAHSSWTPASIVLDRYRSISSDTVSLWISLWPEYATPP